MQKNCTKNVKLHFQSMLKPYTLQVWAGPGAHQTGQCVAVCCSVLQCVAACCSVLQCAAVCCSVLQCVVVCCSPKRAAIAYAPTPFWHPNNITGSLAAVLAQVQEITYALKRAPFTLKRSLHTLQIDSDTLTILQGLLLHHWRKCKKLCMHSKDHYIRSKSVLTPQQHYRESCCSIGTSARLTRAPLATRHEVFPFSRRNGGTNTFLDAITVHYMCVPYVLWRLTRAPLATRHEVIFFFDEMAVQYLSRCNDNSLHVCYLCVMNTYSCAPRNCSWSIFFFWRNGGRIPFSMKRQWTICVFLVFWKLTHTWHIVCTHDIAVKRIFVLYIHACKYENVCDIHRSMYIYVFIHIYIHMCIYICVYIYVCVCIYICKYTYLFVYLFIHIKIYHYIYILCIHIFISVYIHTFTCMHACIYMCIHEYIYMYIYKLRSCPLLARMSLA